jgi:hypothetical protein
VDVLAVHRTANEAQGPVRRRNHGPLSVHIDLPEEALGAANLRLQVGMPAEIFFRTDSRTTLDYLLAPVTSYLRPAMREPV